jgi:hypothetical protein
MDYENRDKNISKAKANHEKMYIIMKKIEEPAFFTNYFELKPFSENCIFKAVSLLT